MKLTVQSPFSPVKGLLGLGKRAMFLSLSLPKGFTLPLSVLLSLVFPCYNSWWNMHNSENSGLGRKGELSFLNDMPTYHKAAH